MYIRQAAMVCVGTKTLLAWPAAKDEYCTYRGWTVPSDEHPEEAGYLVEYTDGGKPNHPNHTGYVSWSPADVFERTYKPVAETWLARAREELVELDDRLEKLHLFILSDAFSALRPDQRAMLEQQGEHMQAYANTLQARIESADAPLSALDGAKPGTADEPGDGDPNVEQIGADDNLARETEQ